LGGARSGKSAYAESLVEGMGPGLYLATAEAGDHEMAERIRLHQRRRGARWATVEEPLDLSGALGQYTAPGRAVLVDCLTLWLSNIMAAELDVPAETQALSQCLSRLPGPVVLVSNEVGLGIVPETKLGRVFRDHAGRLNQTVARIAGRVVFVAAGLPLIMKDATE
jgi:adenosylcobinamide kinase/adenosylcobinamide-phosphate guanylyltransferase